LVYHKDHTIGQSGFNAEVSHHHGLGEQYFMQSLNTISATLQCSSQHQSPSPPKLMLLPWTYNDNVFHVTNSLLFLPSTKGFSARLAQTGFSSHRGFIFPRAMLILQLWGRVT
jgi:hypothetical protein